TGQVVPAAPRSVPDDRTRTLAMYWLDGRLLGWPDNPKRQAYLLDEIVKAFDGERTYSEREVDAILKGIYEYDHCVVRRALIDFGYMDRDHGVYVTRAR
ncbi:MAG TPA: DUF2087 domain-containing protein, partial [Chloroflexia bacterium]|nr:DUF2087 domain-containing protein [Chloroflexia bacterium]